MSSKRLLAASLCAFLRAVVSTSDVPLAKGLSAGSYNASLDSISGGSVKGVDVSTAISSSAASCFASNGYSFAIARGYLSVGSVDTDVCTSLYSAYKQGVKIRDVYMFPCPRCSKSAATQVSELVSHLKGNCAVPWSGRVWLDIEGSQYWLGDSSSNRKWYQSLVDACKSSGASCGVYSSYYQWEEIFGSTPYAYGSSLPLWYAHYDNNPSFSDFASFGGWSSPHVKQYNGDQSLCGMGVDLNWSPSF